MADDEQDATDKAEPAADDKARPAAGGDGAVVDGVHEVGEKTVEDEESADIGTATTIDNEPADPNGDDEPAEHGTDDSELTTTTTTTTTTTDATDEPAGTDDDDATDEPADSDDTTDDTASAAELTAQITQLRAEYEVLQRKLEASKKPKRLHRPSRHWASIACLVVGAILLPLAVLVRWTSNTVLDTDSYVETVAPLAQNEDIQEAVSFQVSEIVVEVIDIREVAKDALPSEAAILSAPIEAGARSLIQDVVDGLISTDAFEDLWKEANRIGHDNVVAILTGNGNDKLETEGGKIVLEVGPLARSALDRVDEILGTDLSDAIPDEQLDGEFVLVQSDDLADLQDEIRWFDRVSWLLPILSIGLLVASVILSRPRRLGFQRLGIAIIVPMTISLLLYTWLRGQYIDGLSEDIHNPDAATALFDITTRFVPRDMRVLLVFGVVILFLSWLFGPTGWAGRTRAWWNALVGKASGATADRDVGQVPGWVATNERTLLVTAVALGSLTLVLWTRPTGLVVLLVVVGVGLVMGAVHILAEIGRRAEPPEASAEIDEAPTPETSRPG